eukprot:525316_1
MIKQLTLLALFLLIYIANISSDMILYDGRKLSDIPPRSFSHTRQMLMNKMQDPAHTDMTKTKRLYHATNEESAKLIHQSQQMKCGKHGMMGAAIYFTEEPQHVVGKAVREGWIIVADVYVGKPMIIEYPDQKPWVKQITYESLQSRGFDSATAPKGRGSGKPEWAIYCPSGKTTSDQVKIVRVVSQHIDSRVKLINIDFGITKEWTIEWLNRKTGHCRLKDIHTKERVQFKDHQVTTNKEAAKETSLWMFEKNVGQIPKTVGFEFLANQGHYLRYDRNNKLAITTHKNDAGVYFRIDQSPFTLQKIIQQTDPTIVSLKMKMDFLIPVGLNEDGFLFIYGKVLSLNKYMIGQTQQAAVGKENHQQNEKTWDRFLFMKAESPIDGKYRITNWKTIIASHIPGALESKKKWLALSNDGQLFLTDNCSGGSCDWYFDAATNKFSNQISIKQTGLNNLYAKLSRLQNPTGGNNLYGSSGLYPKYSTDGNDLYPQFLTVPNINPTTYIEKPNENPETSLSCVEDIDILKELLAAGLISLDNPDNEVYQYGVGTDLNKLDLGYQGNLPSKAVKFALTKPLPQSNGLVYKNGKIFYHGSHDVDRLRKILLGREGLRESTRHDLCYGPGVYLSKSYWMATFAHGHRKKVIDKDGKEYYYILVLQTRAMLQNAIRSAEANTARAAQFSNTDANIPDNDMEYVFHRKDVQIVGIIVKKFSLSERVMRKPQSGKLSAVLS